MGKRFWSARGLTTHIQAGMQKSRRSMFILIKNATRNISQVTQVDGFFSKVFGKNVTFILTA